jgi:octaprenyl-diphosphate synthase
VADYIIASGGKRLRPLLVMLCARSITPNSDRIHDQPLPTNIYTLAAVIEFIHNATLLHDDVVDESPLRRGRKTAHTVFGNAASVLVGDFLYSRSFELMVESNHMGVMSLLAKTTNQIAEGEVWQLMNIADTSLTEARYIEVLQYKTATLFSAACQLPALIHGLSKEQAALAQYGLNLGLSFQIMDDYLDYAGNPTETGKTVGQDLKEGKLTLPLLWLLRHANEQTQTIIKTVVNKVLEANQSDEAEDQLMIHHLIDSIKHSAALPYTQAFAERFANLAIESLSELPNSKAKDALVDLCGYNLKRTQ